MWTDRDMSIIGASRMTSLHRYFENSSAAAARISIGDIARDNDQEHVRESHGYLHQELHCLLNNHRVNAPVSLWLSQSQLVNARRNIGKVHREMQNDDGFFECCCDRTAKDRFPTYSGKHNLTYAFFAADRQINSQRQPPSWNLKGLSRRCVRLAHAPGERSSAQIKGHAGFEFDRPAVARNLVQR